jgi:hypothetical protein
MYHRSMEQRQRVWCVILCTLHINTCHVWFYVHFTSTLVMCDFMYTSHQHLSCVILCTLHTLCLCSIDLWYIHINRTYFRTSVDVKCWFWLLALTTYYNKGPCENGNGSTILKFCLILMNLQSWCIVSILFVLSPSIIINQWVDKPSWYDLQC